MRNKPRANRDVLALANWREELRQKWAKPPAPVWFWDKYNYRVVGLRMVPTSKPPHDPKYEVRRDVHSRSLRLELAGEQPQRRKRIEVRRDAWAAVVNSARMAALADSNPSVERALTCLGNPRTSPSGRAAALKRIVLAEVRETRDLNETWSAMSEACANSTAEANAKFLRNVGEALKSGGKNAVAGDNPSTPNDPLNDFLIAHWAVCGAPPSGVFLGIFSDAVITKLVNKLFARDMNSTALTSARTDALLVKLPRAVIRRVEFREDRGHLIVAASV
jgi:hypothetical protein